MKKGNERQITCADLEGNPFQPLERVSLSVLDQWFDNNFKAHGEQMGSNLLKNLGRYIELRRAAEIRQEEARQAFGIIGENIAKLMAWHLLRGRHTLVSNG